MTLVNRIIRWYNQSTCDHWWVKKEHSTPMYYDYEVWDVCKLCGKSKDCTNDAD